MEPEYDAVVVGAGALGLSTGLHLGRLGRRVAVVDRFRHGSQTSSRAAGLFKHLQRHRALSELARLSCNQALAFAREFEVPLQVVRSGSLIIARTRAHADRLRQEVEQAAAWGLEFEQVDAAGAHRLAPLLEPRDIVAAYHTPGDLYIEEPRSLLDAYRAAADRFGVQVCDDSPVTAIQVERGGVHGVVIGERSVRTPIVVDAAGAWAPQIARLAGGTLNVQPMRHQLLITQPIAGVETSHPIVRVIDAAAYVRPARTGLMLGGFESDPLVTAPDEHTGFSMDQLRLDLEVVHSFQSAMERSVPALNAPLAELRGGLVTMTPDGRLVVGPVPGVRGLWACTGCNASGFSLSPGVGQVLAEWIVGGKAPIDLGDLGPGRFTGLDPTEIRSHATSQYARYYG